MLTEKDYCDYETCVALVKLGFPRWELPYDILSEKYRLRLCDAQKWLREEKGLYVEIEIFEYTYGYRILDTKNVYYDNEHVVRDNGCLVGSYEDALLEGIKKTVKLLKEK